MEVFHHGQTWRGGPQPRGFQKWRVPAARGADNPGPARDEETLQGWKIGCQGTEKTGVDRGREELRLRDHVQDGMESRVKMTPCYIQCPHRSHPSRASARSRH